MGACDPAEAVEILDRLLSFFRDGERWTKGRLSDRRGNRCLLGALDFVGGHNSIKGDAAERYLADEISVAPADTGIGGECARFRLVSAGLCPGDGIGSARLSFAGTPFPILTMGARTLPSCGRSLSRRARRRWMMRAAGRRNRPVSTPRPASWSWLSGLGL